MKYPARLRIYVASHENYISEAVVDDLPGQDKPPQVPYILHRLSSAMTVAKAMYLEL